MFTGIIQAVGRVDNVVPRGADLRLHIDVNGLDMADVGLGDSIACNGVCLTAIAVDNTGFEVDVSAETLRCTIGFVADQRINLEKAMRVQDRLGGHLVSGHVDGVAEILRFDAAGDCMEMLVRAPHILSRYVVTKGSVTINGVSLTVNSVDQADFSINLIPHTLQHTNLHLLTAGSHVNLEIDMMARYAERILNYAREFA